MTKKILIVVALMVAFLVLTSTVAVAGPPGPPLPKDLQCRGAVDLDNLVPGHGVVTVSDVGSGGDIRELTVTVDHGPNGSSHVITYRDNDGSESLTCGDTILDIT